MPSNRPAPMWAMDATSFRFVVANQDAARLFGYSKEALLLLTIYDILMPDEWARFQTTFGPGNRNGDSGEWKCRWPDGSHFAVGFRQYETVINGNEVILAWAVKIIGHLVLAAPLFPDINGQPATSDVSRAHSCYD
jgi:PAS domain S-box-containing protein